ncbi:MAG: acetolactate synthase small subunit [Bacteroidota bacterium]|uniref:acetolactate synthase small subunit n=1 Tax=Parabacteroides sp. FAFU027 TaxID=2922715 RepID=UPI001FAFA01B|nr:acetolactate synthase small subunit [Parabacteroides sp. FAFU027]MDP4270979.1 acetolactate synthase small subunit [Bacteroidota bacterium]
MELFTIIVFSENQPGLLSQVSNIFTRRQINIESLTVSASSIEGIHKYTITVFSTKDMVDKVVKQIEKRVDVVKAYFYTDEEVIYQEIALYKVATNIIVDHVEVENLVRKYNARFLEINRDYAVLELTGHTEDTQLFFEELKQYGVMQFVRSGRIAITKSSKELLSNFLEKRAEKAD